MSYINYKLLYNKGLDDTDFHILKKLMQKEFPLLEMYEDLEERIKMLLDLDLITYLKNGNGKLDKLRVNKKGISFLQKLNVVSYTDEIGQLVKYLIDIYKANDKYVGNELEIQDRVIWFLGETPFNHASIKSTVDEYLVNNPEYTKSLENLVWSPPSKAFSVHKNLKDSQLFDLLCDKYQMNKRFFIDKKSNKTLDWLENIVSLDPPKRMDSELYLTGNYKSDMDFINKAKRVYFRAIQNNGLPKK